MDNNRKITTNEDPFLRLPAELLLSSVFSRLADLKSLFFCSLVSKHFASVISHVRTVSITVSGSETYCYFYSRIMAKLVTDLHNSTVEQIPALLDSPSLQHMKLPKFLENLRELEKIHLEYEYAENGVQPSYRTWEVNFAGNSAKIESFVALVRAGSIHFGDSEDESDPDQEEEGSDQEEGNDLEQEGNSVDDLKEIRKCLYLFYGRYMEWMCVIRMLLKYHSSLQSVTITDSRKQGTLVIGHEQLVNIGNEVFDEVVKELSQKIIRTVWLPDLSLPLSGYFMRRVSVLTLHAPGENPRASDDDESTVIKELIQVILKNHRDRIRYYGPLCLP